MGVVGYSCSWLIMWICSVMTIMSMYIGGWCRKMWKQISKNEKKRRDNPKNWPIVGCLIEAFRNYDHLHDWCHSFFSNDNRTVKLNFFSTRIYLTVDPANVEHILRTNFRNYPKGARTREKMEDLLGSGIFNVDDKAWKKQHKIASAIFCDKNLKNLSLLSFRKDSLRLVTTLSVATLTNQPINLQDLLLGMTMDSISRVGFGIEEEGLSNVLNTFTQAFDRANAMISRRFVNVWWKAQKILKLGTENLLLHDLTNLNDFTSWIIAHRRVELGNLLSTRIMGSNTSYFKVKDDILSKLLDFEGEACTEKGIRDFILNFIIAGRDTTAVTMSWFIYNMCKKHEVADKIYQEVKDVIHCGGLQYCKTNSLNKFEDVANRLTFQSLSRMHYLHAALTETLRLYPAVPRDTKLAIHDDVLPDGTRIRGGDHVAYVPYSMGRMEFLWGSDALEFKPERWLKDGEFLQASPFMFSSFQAGPRMCLGKDWAYVQMKMAMALLIYFFRFRLVPNNIVKYRMTMVLAMANGLQVFVHNRHVP